MSGIITVDIDFPKDWNSVFEGNAGYARINMFNIIDEQGNNVEYQILNIDYDKETYNKQDIINVDRYTVAIDSIVLPFGTTCFKIVPAEKLNNIPRTMHEGNLIAENEYLTLKISNTGDINIIDKSNGRQYKNLNTFIDESDTGNGWFYESAAINSPSIVSSGGYVEVINNGPLVNSFRITKEMIVPAKSDAINQNRSSERISMNISTIVTLKAHSKTVEFSTTVNNTPKDHRVRVIFPTQIQGDDYLASQAFCFINRKRGVSSEGVNYREPESYEKNTSGIISISDNENKFSFIGREGLHEAGVYPDGTISVTMFRGFGREFHEKNSQTAQLNKKLTFSYAVCLDDASLFGVQKEIFRKPITHMSDMKLKSANSIISLEKGNAEVSVIKPAENNDGWIIRMYNPTSKLSENTLKINISGARLYETNLEEIIESEIHMDNDLASVRIEPWKIKTLLIKNK